MTVKLLLEPDSVALIDAAAASTGIDSALLMRKAGLAVSSVCLARHPGALRFVILAGPGNNGGDGYVAAQGLGESGAPTVVYSLGGALPVTGDALRAATDLGIAPLDLDEYRPAPGDVVIDALFGAGLSRDLPNSVQAVINRVMAAKVPVIAVDIPSGIDGHSGQIRGAAFRAERTVTFMAAKPGMVLMPGRMHCGEVDVIDIGIPQRMVDAHASKLAINHPDLFAGAIKSKGSDSHKFSHGHLLVFSGPATSTGAARMAAMAGLRGGAGLVSIAAKPQAVPVLANHVTAIMLRILEGPDDIARIVNDNRINAIVIGPAFGIGQDLIDLVLAMAGKKMVLDADAITSFAAEPERLFALLSGAECRAVLTPHDGEFARLFPGLAASSVLSKPDKALAAATRSHAVIVLKGADTVIAAPDGRVAVNTDAPPALATAGSGDVLAGLIGAGLAGGMPAYEAALHGVWLHSCAGREAGIGLTAETLINHIHPLIT